MRKRKALIGRTGSKHKQQCKHAAVENAPPQQTDHDPVAAPVEPQSADLNSDDEFRTWQVLSRVVDEMVRQVVVEDAQIQRERVRHEMYAANAIACAEALKRPQAPAQFGCWTCCMCAVLRGMAASIATVGEGIQRGLVPRLQQGNGGGLALVVFYTAKSVLYITRKQVKDTYSVRSLTP